MISSIVNLVLLAALVGTSVAVMMMYRRLRRFDVLQGEAAKEFARTAAALDRAREAIGELAADGGEMAVTLAARLNEARLLINDIEEATLRTQEAAVLAQAPMVEHAPPPHRTGNVVPLTPAPAFAGAVEVEDAAVEGTPGHVSAAIRIRNAARARIDAAKRKATQAPVRPTPQTAPLPDRLIPTIHRADPAGAIPADARRGSEAPWPEGGRVTWHDLARAAQLAS